MKYPGLSIGVQQKYLNSYKKILFMEIKNMDSIYTSGRYLETTRTWHAEDSSWKADQISKIIHRNCLRPRTIAEVGCGAGGILHEIHQREHFTDIQFSGYDISPQAIELAKNKGTAMVKFFQEDLIGTDNDDYFDILLVIDVFEHISDYMGFLEKCRFKASYKIFHIPLDIHVSSIVRNSLVGARYTIGHLHYFTADLAIAVLKDTGYEILDHFYTTPSFGLFREHPSVKKAVANIPRWIFSKFNLPFTARMFGGYSLLVLAK